MDVRCGGDYSQGQIEVESDICKMMEQMSAALQVAVERETIYRSIELERQKFYERSIRDPLTGLLPVLHGRYPAPVV